MADPEKKPEENQKEEKKATSKKEEVGNKEILEVLKSVNENLQKLSKREQIEEDADKSVKKQIEIANAIKLQNEVEESSRVDFEQSFDLFEHNLKNEKYCRYEIRELVDSENPYFMYNFIKLGYLEAGKQLEAMFKDKEQFLTKDFDLWTYQDIAFKKHKSAPVRVTTD